MVFPSEELERITVLFQSDIATPKSSSTLTLETLPSQRKKTTVYKTPPELKSYLESHVKSD